MVTCHTVAAVGVELRAMMIQPRSQHSRVGPGMLRQNNQHTSARAAVLAVVLSQPEWSFYNYE